MILCCLSFMLLHVTCLYFFFFFKQKTAYEMRISDWSSDVCSYDLISGNGAAPVTVIDQSFPGISITNSNRADHELFLGNALQSNPQTTQIGRASCRERVCQYV